MATWIPLLAIPPAVALTAWLVARKDWFTRRKIRVATLTGLALALALAALCRPTVPRPGVQPATVVLVGDASPSMRTGIRWMRAADWVRDELPADTPLALVAFTGRTAAAMPAGGDVPRPAGDLPQAAGTDIAAALRSAATLADVPERTAVLLYSDGYETTGDAAAAAADLRRRGLTVYCLPAAKTEPPANAALIRLDAPPRADAGGPAKVRLAVRASVAGPVNVRIVRRHAPTAAPLAEQAVDLRPNAAAWLTFDLRFAGVGVERLAAELVRPEGEDAVPEDDRWAFDIELGDTRPVLVVSYRSEEGRSAEPLALGDRYDVTRIDAAALPADPSAYGGLRAVVLDDVPFYALSAPALAALETFVGDLGGGLVALGGDHAFGPGGYGGTVLDRMLPVRSDPDRPPMHIALVLDRSASMARKVALGTKLELAKSGVLEIGRFLRPGDRLSVVLFNHATATPARDVPPAEWNRLRAELSGVEARGGTQMGPALLRGIELLADAPPLTADGRPIRRRLIVLSDGRSEPFDLDTAIELAREADVTISAVSTAETGTWPGLERLPEATGGRLYDLAEGLVTPDGRNRLGRIFLEDLPLGRAIGEPAPARIAEMPPLWPEGERPTAAAVPPAPQHVATRKRDGATVHLATTADPPHPLAATWRYGLGCSAAWPVPRNDATRDWFDSPTVADTMARTFAWATSRPPAGADYDVTVHAEDGRVVAEAMRRSLPGGLDRMPDLALALAGDAATLTGQTLEPTGPGRWRTVLDVPPGAYAWTLSARNGGEVRRVRGGRVHTGPALEFRRLDVDADRLAAIAEAGGGRVLASPGEVSQIVPKAGIPMELWPLLVVGAALAVLAEALWPVVFRGR